MTKVKYLIITVFIGILLCLIPNAVNAVVEAKRNVSTASRGIEFEITGLTLETGKEYQYRLIKTQTAENVESEWKDIVNPTATSVTINIRTTDSKTKEIINEADTAYIAIREKETKEAVGASPISVDLKIPYLYVTNYAVLTNGKEFKDVTKSDNIAIQIRDSLNSDAEYKYEKITDNNLINKYKEIKEKKGDFLELQSLITTKTPSDSNWVAWSYWGGGVPAEDGGYGKTQRTISAPDTGLYYMWLKFTGEEIKPLYGLILVDNLSEEISLEKITLPATAEVELGQTLNVGIVFTPSGATNKKVTWSSSDESVATVDNTGKVTPKKVGQTIITAVSEDGNKTANCTVTVKNASSNGEDNGQNSGNGNNGQNGGNSGNNGSGSNNNGNSGNQGGKDDTTVKGKLPQTGVNMIVTFGTVATALIAVESFRRYRKNRI